MPNQSMTLDIPSGLYTRMQKRAEQARRSVEDETLELLAANFPTDELPDELHQAIASLELLENEAVERAARNRLPAELSRELETLHLKKQREGLTAAESERCAELVRAYERAMLVRAQALALLKKRGLELASLVAQP